jgi:DNA-binding NarL/FixJ family response regulator
MKRLLLILAAIVATGGIAATPAVAGLAGNPSFSHQIPVPVPSQARPDELLAAVRSAAEGHAPLDPRVAGALLPGREPPAADLLSEREKQVLRLAAAGLANKQIAGRLGVSESTVKVHIGNIFRQIGVRDRTSAALWAREHLPSP